MVSTYTRIYPAAKDELASVAARAELSQVATLSFLIHACSILGDGELAMYLAVGETLQAGRKWHREASPIELNALLDQMRLAVIEGLPA